MRKVKKITCKIAIDSDGHARISVHGGAGDTRDLEPIARPIVSSIVAKLREQIEERNNR